MALTDTFIKQVKHKGSANGEKYSDAAGLHLLVRASGKHWRLAYRFLDKQKLLALGSYPAVSLAKARQLRDKAKELLAAGVDPSSAKREEKAANAAASANTFEVVGRAWLAKTAPRRKAVTQEKVKTWLEKDVFPFIGKLPISTIGPRDVLERVIKKLEARSAIDTAHRVKQLCGQVFRFAVVSGLAERDVTADLREALMVRAGKHHAAIVEPNQLGALLRSIDGYAGHPTTAAALKLSALLFLRPGELRHAEWSEIQLDKALWVIPGAKMKMGVDHTIPLCSQAIGILRSLHPITGHGRFAFPSIRTGERPMSENTVNAALRGMGYGSEIHSAHGFRASARTIMDEVLGERVDLIEHQLAHKVRDANGRAYNRTTHLPERKEMMQRWADYLDKLRIGADIIPLRGAA